VCGGTASAGAGRLDGIDKVVIRTHESALRIIDKKGRCTILRTAITACSTWSPLR
jgi:2-methylcitrate dehydratase PrpD